MPARAFTAYPFSVPAARDYVVALLHQQPAELQETAAVLVSELATNAVRHSGGRDFEVSVEHEAGANRLWVGVTDTGAGNPVLRRPPDTDEHGRGLQLVGLLADRWGVRRRRSDDAKTVWFELTSAATSTQPHSPGHKAPEPAANAFPGHSPSSSPTRPDSRPSATRRPPLSGSAPGTSTTNRSRPGTTVCRRRVPQAGPAAAAARGRRVRRRD